MNALGIIFSNIHDNNVPELTMNRTIGAIPFAGRYRLIDFTLSSMVNSGITHVGCVTKRNYRSLIDHVGSGKEWDLARKNGGFVLLPPFGEKDSDTLYSTRLEALKTVLGFINRCKETYVVMSDTNSVYNINFTKMLENHIDKKADVSLLYVRKNVKDISGTNNVILKMNADKAVKELSVDPVMTGEVDIYGNICIMRKDFLVSLVANAIAHGIRHFVKEALAQNLDAMKVIGYEHIGYFEEISSLQRFYNVNLALLDKSTRDGLFGASEVYTKNKDSAPTEYGANVVVKNSLISDGCIIEGEVYNSIIFRGVKIGRGAVVKNSILMKSTVVGDYANVNAVITDKNVTIRDRRVLSGCETLPFYLRKDLTV